LAKNQVKYEYYPRDFLSCICDYVPMLKHAQIWLAIDRLAERYGLSPSGLAKRAGLDPTTFNKSKRLSAQGKLRWPSTESVAKILEATGSNLADFLGLLAPPIPADETALLLRHIPLIGAAQAGHAGYFDDAGYPVGSGWDEVAFPDIGDDQAYALEISGDSMEPLYRDGDVVIVSPAASVRRGDRIIAKTKTGEVMAKILSRQTANRVELSSLNPAYPPRSFSPDDFAWMSRIVWVSQ
jgi:phage repressor protein C with HTH and peptisase S24 domain